MAQCPYEAGSGGKDVNIKYDISAKLDTRDKKVVANQTIHWKNISDVNVTELRMYMYMNAFKHLETTFLKGSNGVIFGTDIKTRNANEWGYINIANLKNVTTNKSLQWKYIQPDDGNIWDESVISIALDQAIKPGQSIVINMDFESKLPKFIARAGYSRDEFYAFLHWFPQLGVYEQNKKGNWYWNCHQFFRQTEFFADFADFNVTLTLPDQLIVGSSGCLVDKKLNKKTGSQVLKIEAQRVIDFAWLAYPDFLEYKSEWNGVAIKLLIPPEHCNMASRYIGAIKNALDFFKERVATYPYPSITIVDPPMHGLGAGFMEYPMLITCASFHYVPEGIRTIESLAVHEFSHQFFMAVLASNEKEEAWMDEGLVNFFEDEIMDHYHGEKKSIIDIFGYTTGNKERSRFEYTTLEDLTDGYIARPGWEFERSNYKELVYAKTSTILQTLKGLVGEKKFYNAIKHYYDKHKFTHPKEDDFISCMKYVIGDTIVNGLTIDQFFKAGLHGSDYCDYRMEAVKKIDNGTYRIEVKRDGGLMIPQEITLNYDDGSCEILHWNGVDSEKVFTIKTEKNIQEVVIDIDHKNYLDINFNNNSLNFEKVNKPGFKYAYKTITWFQHILQSLSFLM